LKIPLLDEIIDFIFPKVCIVTGNKLPESNSNQFISDNILKFLSQVNNNDLIELKLKLKSDLSLSYFRFQENSDIQKVIHYMKYGGMKNLGRYLGTFIMSELSKTRHFDIFNDFNTLAPVPLFKSKLRERGYNQSHHISEGINDILKIKYIDDLLIRVKNTKSQTHLKIKERELNIKNAFQINSKYKDEIEKINVIVIDDVVTTGTTLNEITKVLRKNGVRRIMNLTLAMTVYPL
jgi:competence protein ComFC